MVAVLDEISGFLRAASAEVDDEHRLDTGSATPGDELVGSESIRFRRAPGVAQPSWSLLEGADSILPIVGRDKISTGVTHDCDPKFLDKLDHVATKASFIGRWVTRLVDASI